MQISRNLPAVKDASSFALGRLIFEGTHRAKKLPTENARIGTGHTAGDQPEEGPTPHKKG